MKIVQKTDVGKVRTSNQDACASGNLPDGTAWAVVCDGMGGAAGGNVASTTAVEIISEQIKNGYHSSMQASSIKNLLLSSINAANISVYDLSKKNSDLNGMGTTVVAVVVKDHIAYIAHAGDSRAYLLEDHSLLQLTKDHSVVQEMVEKGKITQTEAQSHPNKNLITRALGVHENISLDFDQQDLTDQSMLILCTDGLTNYVKVAEICAVSSSSESVQQFADFLVDKANKNGGGDNITIVTLTY